MWNYAVCFPYLPFQTSIASLTVGLKRHPMQRRLTGVSPKSLKCQVSLGGGHDRRGLCLVNFHPTTCTCVVHKLGCQERGCQPLLGGGICTPFCLPCISELVRSAKKTVDVHIKSRWIRPACQWAEAAVTSPFILWPLGLWQAMSNMFLISLNLNIHF